MIEKYCHIHAFDGVQQNVFVLPDQELFKTASITKQAEVSDEVSDFVSSMPREKGHKYVLVNGIGAGEFWSSNRNGDYFPEGGLKHAGDDYGYQTFKAGHNFVHHDNKDPLKAVGTVKFASYNPRMHRVELILDTDMAKLARTDPTTYEKVANDEPVDVSMGSKCDFDVCSICSNRAATRSEYCGHLKTAMNQITGSGQKVYAYTPHPRFFDISYVTKGADVTAKALQYLDKAASDESFTITSEKPASGVRLCPDPTLHEEVSCEATYTVPEFPEGHKLAVALLENVEPALSISEIDALAKVGYCEALSTASHLGIVLRPEEYQRLTLLALDQKDLADRLVKEGAVIDVPDAAWFDPSVQTVRAQYSGGNFNFDAADILAGHVAKRSFFEPFMTSRLEKACHVPDETVAKIAAERALEKDASGFMTPEIAATLALGYIIYRKGIQEADVNSLRNAIHDPGASKKLLMILVPLIAAGSIIDRMMSFDPPTGSREKKAGMAAEVLGPLGASYLYSAYARRKAERGQPISGVEHLFMDYPSAIGLAGVLGVSGVKRSLKGTMGKRSGNISVVQHEKTSGLASDALLAFGAGMYRPRLSGLLALLADTAIASGVAHVASGVKKKLTD